MNVKLIDIAKKANVSKSTVSRALNNNSKVNYETKKKIIEIAKKLNYIPNHHAKSLANKKSNIIGVVVPRIDNLFFAELIQAFKEEIKQYGYNLILCTTDNEEKELSKYINIFKSGHVDGVFIAFVAYNNKKVYSLLDMNIPVVYATNYLNYQENKISCFSLKLEEGCYQATNYLISLKHKKIAFVGGKDKRYIGYAKAMLDNNLPINTTYVLKKKNWFELGKTIAHDYNKPSALICYSDEIAVSLIQSLTKEGVKVPEEISICGFDNIKSAEFSNPSLTTVNIPNKRIGKEAAKLLFNKLNNDENKNLINNSVNIKYDCKLIKRESTTSIKA